ncbi:MAG: hypothetical protein PHY48_06890 [Candidatus Cloacimonetes bacterium]|nr:hypothetical protein [Candidatus Cloacimonadota bacterium]
MTYAKKIVLTILFGAIIVLVQAKPYWINEIPDSDYFLYFSGVGIRGSEQEARNTAFSDALSNVAQYKNLQIESFTETKQREQSSNNDSYEYDETTKLIKFYGTGKNIVGLRVVAESHNVVQGKHHYYILVRLPKAAEYTNKPIYKNQSKIPLLKSAVAPGWGQFSKHDTNKGIFIVVSEGISLLSAASFKIIGDDYYSKSHNGALTYAQQQINRDNADTAYLYASISLSIAGVIYLYNLIDAVSTNSNPRFTENEFIPSMKISICNNQYNLNCTLRF